MKARPRRSLGRLGFTQDAALGAPAKLFDEEVLFGIVWVLARDPSRGNTIGDTGVFGFASRPSEQLDREFVVYYRPEAGQVRPIGVNEALAGEGDEEE